MPAPPVPRLVTVGEIVRRTGLPHHKVEYLLDSRNVAPIGWAGNARVYSDDVVTLIAAESARADSPRRTGVA